MNTWGYLCSLSIDIVGAVMTMTRLNVNWDQLRTEYIGGKSINTLSDRYGVSRSTIANHVRREKWTDMRNRAAAIVGITPTARNGKGIQMLFGSEKSEGLDPIEQITDQCLRVVKTGLDRIEAGMGIVDPKDAQTIRSYCSSLKDLQSVAGAFAGMTRQEIAARIEQIQRQRQIDEEYGTGIVMIPAVQEAGDG